LKGQRKRKRKSRWSQGGMQTTEKAKRFVLQLNEQMALYPEGYSARMTEDQRKQYVEQKELQGIYETMMSKRHELEQYIKQNKFKHEYDSDEEVQQEGNGTWEHQVRGAEMEITREWAVKLTDMARGKHHIGDFLPPDELEKFMETYSALKEGRTPDLSDYKEFKIQAENIGYQLLEKLGWSEGKGLGKHEDGIVVPVNKGITPVGNSGLGQDRPSELARTDDEYQMYRKRMMLAYKFRPNPL
ncbi:unnamed protein product, partial [Didymodactylos carnosus]